MPAEPQWIDIALRLDGTASEKLIEFLDKDGGSYLVVRELEDSNPHFHAVVHSKRKLQAFRSAFVRACVPPGGGNRAYSLTLVRDLDKYERYLCKGAALEEEPQVVASNGLKYDASWIAETHERYWSENQAIKEARAKLPVAEFTLLECRDRKVPYHDKKAIALVYIRELVQRRKAINIFSVRSSVALIAAQLCPDDTAIEELATSVAAF